jgi:hypothetical protein
VHAARRIEAGRLGDGLARKTAGCLPTGHELQQHGILSTAAAVTGAGSTPWTAAIIAEALGHDSLESTRIYLLTRNRLALLRGIRAQRPGSIYELAKTVKRDLKNVQQDLRILEEYGLIRMTAASRAGKRRVKVPEAPFAEIALKIAI